MSVYEMVKQAIINKQHIHADYDGHHREMCPHVLGRKDGRAQALFYQFGGTSSAGLGPDGDPGNWRCIPIEGLKNVSVHNGPWHTAMNHSRKQTCVRSIDVEVTF